MNNLIEQNQFELYYYYYLINKFEMKMMNL